MRHGLILAAQNNPQSRPHRRSSLETDDIRGSQDVASEMARRYDEHR
jgi:hypothetical protein